MGAKIRIKTMLVIRNKSYKDLADMTGTKYQTIKNKLFRDSLNYNYVEKVADLLGFDVVFRDRETGKEV